ncbi:MAG TPA: hypothetical protein VJ697_13030 [Nitrososphaeraceae archaeon]|nr:hypothetical protein [Nitrososphaeraceae archaeon]
MSAITVRESSATNSIDCFINVNPSISYYHFFISSRLQTLTAIWFIVLEHTKDGLLLSMWVLNNKQLFFRY